MPPSVAEDSLDVKLIRPIESSIGISSKLCRRSLYELILAFVPNYNRGVADFLVSLAFALVLFLVAPGYA